MCSSNAARLALSTLLTAAALSACYVVPIDPRTGQPVTVNQPASVMVVQPAVSAATVPALTQLQARLYPVNEQAQAAGLVIASIIDQHVGRGSISLSYKGQPMQGDATRVDAAYPGFGRVHSQVLGASDLRSTGGRRGVANAYGANGVSAQCEYIVSGSSIGTGACLFSDGAKFQMHFSQ